MILDNNNNNNDNEYNNERDRVPIMDKNSILLNVKCIKCGALLRSYGVTRMFQFSGEGVWMDLYMCIGPKTHKHLTILDTEDGMDSGLFDDVGNEGI